MQDDIFFKDEGNKWFDRNKQALISNVAHEDIINSTILNIKDLKSLNSVLDIGCSNGWRLNTLKPFLNNQTLITGIDASKAAITDGMNRYSGLNLHYSTIKGMSLERKFDLIIVSFVLHWVDRSNLFESLFKIDSLLNNNGYLIIADFLPDYPTYSKYHHLPQEKVYTYKQYYPEIFIQTNLYKEISKKIYAHNNIEENPQINFIDPQERCFVSVLKKNNLDYYSKNSIGSYNE